MLVDVVVRLGSGTAAHRGRAAVLSVSVIPVVGCCISHGVDVMQLHGALLFDPLILGGCDGSCPPQCARGSSSMWFRRLEVEEE